MARATTGRTSRRFGGAATIIAATAFTSVAFAQEPGPPAEAAPSVSPAAPTPPPPPPAEATPAWPPPPPVAAPAPAPAPMVERSTSDLDVEARRWAIGYGGLSQVPVGGPTALDITVPSIALRYWVNPTVGIDVGFGLGWRGGSTEGNGISTDKDSVTGFIFQAGVPFALSTHRHVSFQVIPFVAVAHGQTTQTPPVGSGQSPIDFSGTRIDIGARAGFELFFGFIGIPELALSATIGLQFESRKYSAESNGITGSDTSLAFSTTVENNPWDIFAGNVAARYYF